MRCNLALALAHYTYQFEQLMSCVSSGRVCMLMCYCDVIRAQYSSSISSSVSESNT